MVEYGFPPVPDVESDDAAQSDLVISFEPEMVEKLNTGRGYQPENTDR